MNEKDNIQTFTRQQMKDFADFTFTSSYYGRKYQLDDLLDKFLNQ